MVGASWRLCVVLGGPLQRKDARWQRRRGSCFTAARASSVAPHANVEYRVAPAEQSGLPHESVALITVAQALHWFDRERFYAEAKRVLRPTGVLAAWAYGVDEVEGD